MYNKQSRHQHDQSDLTQPNNLTFRVNILFLTKEGQSNLKKEIDMVNWDLHRHSLLTSFEIHLCSVKSLLYLYLQLAS